MNKFKDRMITVVSEIKSNRSIFRNIRGFIGEPIDDSRIQKVEEERGLKLPDSLVSFYKTTSTLELHWDFYGNESVRGRISIPDLSLLFDNTVSSYTNTDCTGHYFFGSSILTEKEIEKLKGYYVLDNLGLGNVVLFKLEPDMTEPELFLFTYLNTLTPLKLSFNEYIETAIEARGMYLWQQYATTETHFKNGLAINDNFFENIAQLFPDADISRLSKGLTPAAPTLNEIKKVDYVALFQKRVTEFSRRNGVSIKKFEVFPGAPVAYLIKAQESLQKQLPESMLNFYACTNGLKLEWEWKNQLLGTINILPIEEIFGGEAAGMKIDWNDPDDHKNSLWFEDFEDEDIEFLKQLRPFEKWPGVNEDMAISFQNEEPEFYYLVPRGEDQKMSLSFAEYLDHLLTFLGLTHWPELLLGKADIIIGDTPLKDYVKAIFPEIEVEEY